MNKLYKKKFKEAAEKYLDKNVRELKEADPSKAYSTLKRMGAQPGDGNNEGSFNLLNHMENNMTAEECTEQIAVQFAEISQEYPPLDVESLSQDVKEKLQMQNLLADLPKIIPVDVYNKMRKSKKTKSQVPGDLPKSILKEFLP